MYSEENLLSFANAHNLGECLKPSSIFPHRALIRSACIRHRDTHAPRKPLWSHSPCCTEQVFISNSSHAVSIQNKNKFYFCLPQYLCAFQKDTWQGSLRANFFFVSNTSAWVAKWARWSFWQSKKHYFRPWHICVPYSALPLRMKLRWWETHAGAGSHLI